jgi:hypothetical protein
MTIKEAFIALEKERARLQKENEELKKDNIELHKENKSLKSELKKLAVSVKPEPKVEEVEPQVTSIVANVDGETYADIVEGDTVSIDDVVEEQKPKRSRRRKNVESIEE